ncbi:hypothetical protein BC936DRAFT_148300 [Jimgerdemannia flammicorona]|uniref:Phospholipase n=1 Tax=Jimgerdemannia flammicorona TaxID=994334 RepID=A0A433D3D3_9FUNG|nr:hypothetical protein BC936DRAFT_148300 [Jimgerdemannia flammicorona]
MCDSGPFNEKKTSIMSFLGDIVNKISANTQETVFKAQEFAENHFGYVDEEAREAALIAQKHRFHSFAPLREASEVKWYVDGKDYFWAISEAIEDAKHHIYIEDWWLSPELHLRRPPHKYPEYRLDTLLKRKAAEGVKIYIVVYEEVEQALTMNSRHTRKALEGNGIVVQRHPDHAIGGTFFWAKMCVVDTRVAFIGGLDACFGRWDTHDHSLADFHPATLKKEIWPGQDYNNARYKDFSEVEKWDLELIDKRSIARMPWHDVSVGIIGQPVLDIAKHFCERWNFIKKEKSLDRDEVIFLEPPLGGFTQSYAREAESHLRVKHHHNIGEVKGSHRVQVLRSSSQWSHDIQTEVGHVWIFVREKGAGETGGLCPHLSPLCVCHTETSTRFKPPTSRAFEAPSILSTSRTNSSVSPDPSFCLLASALLTTQPNTNARTPRLFLVTATKNDPDHEIKNQIGSALVDRIIRASENGEKFRVIVVMPLAPAFAGDFSKKEASVCRLEMHWQFSSICRGEHSIFARLSQRNVNPADYISFWSLRSYDRINRSAIDDILTAEAGIDPNAQTVAGAAEQGFAGRDATVIKADGAEADFVKGTEGSRKKSGVAGWIERAENRIQVPLKGEVKQLEKEYDSAGPWGGEAKDTIAGYAMSGEDLREESLLGEGERGRHGRKIPGDPSHQDEKANYVCEELYIHTKVMIVDDRIVICGSANLNDRSQCGDRDSEIAVIVEDQAPINSRMNGQPYQASRFAATLRRHLFKEHLGLLPPTEIELVTSGSRPPPHPQHSHNDAHADRLVEDPLSDELYDRWTSTARRNTEAFRKVFRCVPDSGISNWDDYKEWVPADLPVGHVANKDLSVSEIRETLSAIRGHLVEFPYLFLNKVDLKSDAILDMNELIMELYT